MSMSAVGTEHLVHALGSEIAHPRLHEVVGDALEPSRLSPSKARTAHHTARVRFVGVFVVVHASLTGAVSIQKRLLQTGCVVQIQESGSVAAVVGTVANYFWKGEITTLGRGQAWPGCDSALLEFQVHFHFRGKIRAFTPTWAHVAQVVHR